MSWDIVYTAQARQDLCDIYEYIALELLAPETAAGQTQRIMGCTQAVKRNGRCRRICQYRRKAFKRLREQMARLKAKAKIVLDE